MTDTRRDVKRAAIKPPTFLDSLAIQCRVIGAIIMRELHSRYGRDNIGYLWVIGEPLIYGAAIAILHGIRGHGVAQGGISPIALGVTGYSIFIIWRGIIGRADSVLPSNMALLQHRMVTILDIVLARNLLELVGCFCALTILFAVVHLMGLMQLPERPIYLLMGILYVFWLAMAIGMIIVGVSYERPVVERLIHPATYFSMPISGAFFMMAWVPEPARSAFLWVPLVHAFEIARYGEYVSCTLEYVDFQYLNLWCLGTTLLGLLSISAVKDRLVV